LIVAGGGRDLNWSATRVATELLCRSHGRPVQCLFHGGARGADAAIDAACSRLGRAAGPLRNRQMLQRACQLASQHPQLPHPPLEVLVLAFPGGPGTAFLLDQARRLQRRSAIPIELAQVQP
jgi:hypothetical protein